MIYKSLQVTKEKIKSKRTSLLDKRVMTLLLLNTISNLPKNKFMNPGSFYPLRRNELQLKLNEPLDRRHVHHPSHCRSPPVTSTNERVPVIRSGDRECEICLREGPGVYRSELNIGGDTVPSDSHSTRVGG